MLMRVAPGDSSAQLSAGEEAGTAATSSLLLLLPPCHAAVLAAACAALHVVFLYTGQTCCWIDVLVHSPRFHMLLPLLLLCLAAVHAAVHVLVQHGEPGGAAGATQQGERDQDLFHSVGLQDSIPVQKSVIIRHAKTRSLKGGHMAMVHIGKQQLSAAAAAAAFLQQQAGS
jgi:hypothetical protein